MHSNIYADQASIFSEDAEHDFLKQRKYKGGIDLEEAMELTMSAWDLVKDAIRDTASSKEKSLRISREILTRGRL